MIVLGASLALAQPAPQVGALPRGVSGAAAVAMDDALFVVGGHEASVYSSAVHRYDPAANVTTQVATLPQGRDTPIAWVAEGRILVAGGAERTNALPPLPGAASRADILEVDPATGAVRVTADALPAGRSGAAVAVVGAKVYILGGVTIDATGTTQHREILVYDGAAAEGSRVSTLSARLPGGVRDARAVAAPDGSILLVGGQIESASGGWTCPPSAALCPSANVARFDPATGRTSVVGALFLPMTSPEVARIGDAAYVVGGVGTNVGPRFNATRIDLATFDVSEVGVVENSTGAAAAVGWGDEVLLLGGRLSNSTTPRAEVRAWSPPAPPPGDEAVAPSPTQLAASLSPREGRASWAVALTWGGPDARYEVLSGATPERLSAVALVVGTHAEGLRALPGTTTWWSVRQLAGDARGASALPIHVVAPPAPAAPSWLFANSTFEGTVALAWDDVAVGNETYVVWRDGEPLVEGLIDAAFTDASPPPDLTHAYEVTTEGDLRSPASPVSYAQVSAGQPEEPPVTTRAPATPPASAPVEATPSPSAPPATATASPLASPSPQMPSPPARAPGFGVLALLVLVSIVAASKR